MQEYLASDPLVIVEAKGNYLIDDRGRRLFDGTSALWCNLFGHRVPEIDQAIGEQLNKFAHTTLLGTTHPAVAELARRLVEIAPGNAGSANSAGRPGATDNPGPAAGGKGLNHVFFSDNGATAVESALKIAFQYRLLTRGKQSADHAAYLSLANAYHGDTLGAASVGGVELFHDIFKPVLLPELKALKTPSPYCYRCPLGKSPNDCSIDCADELDEALKRANGRVCAVILEPGVQAAAGILVLPEGFLTRTKRACEKHGALLILDEVATGFGRTGTLFACQREGVTPDLMCVAKGLTGGYLPVAATLVTDEIYNAFLGRYDEFRHFFHGHTYTGNALGCAAALATLRLLAHPDVLKAVERNAATLKAALEPLAKHPNVGDIRQAGLMCGIELVADKSTKAMFPPGERIGYHICLSLRDRGIFLRPLGDVIVLMPPLSSTEGELRHLASAVHAGIVERLGG
jgi:adenosylmethionine-8-amino-7-oxononanoate aminotransferase